MQLSREILAAQAALARAASQAETDGAARALADKHEARDTAIVQLNRLDEVQAIVLRQPGANERQARLVFFLVCMLRVCREGRVRRSAWPLCGQPPVGGAGDCAAPARRQRAPGASGTLRVGVLGFLSICLEG